MVCHALTIIDDGGISFRGFHTLRAAIREFKLAAILYVLYSEDDSEREQLSVGQVLPQDS